MRRCALAVLVFVACGGGGSGGPVCGDGAVDVGEQCDDGNDIDDDGCSACVVDQLSFCGDNILDPGEACDDGNNLDDDGCSANCVIEIAVLVTNWTFKDLATDTVTGCPQGFDTTSITVTAVGGGTPTIDLYDCASGTGTAGYPPDQYDVNVAITDASGTSIYAAALPEVVDLTTTDQTLTTTIFNDAGYFSLSWMLKGAISNTTLTCAQANAQDVGLDATVTGGATLTSDLFDCTTGQDVSVPILAGSYTVSISALDSNQAAVGIAAPLVNQVIVSPNRVTALGTVVIPIDGQ